jgi:aspartate/methionine/tyrosine aminotransferase
LLEEAGIVLAPGRAFGAGGEGWVRHRFASEPNRLNEALDRFAGFLYM